LANKHTKEKKKKEKKTIHKKNTKRNKQTNKKINKKKKTNKLKRTGLICVNEVVASTRDDLEYENHVYNIDVDFCHK
jgi:hypothetical protein